MEDSHANSAVQRNSFNIDPELSGSCIGLGLQFPHLWQVAERYVRHGDSFHKSAGMAIIADFAKEMPISDAVSLIEWHFEQQSYLPVRGSKPTIDIHALRAAVAIGLAFDISDRTSGQHRRLRMSALLEKAKLSAKDSVDRSVIDRALKAIEREESSWHRIPTPWAPGQIRGHRLDQELVERCAPAFEEGRLDDAIRAAMIVLENRLRTSTDLGLDVVGAELAAKAFSTQSPLNFGETGAEKDGLLNIFRSAFLLFRNPLAHRFRDHTEEQALQILIFVDLLLNLVGEANTHLYQPSTYLAPHEVNGRIRVDGVIKIDVDGDLENETVIVYSEHTHSIHSQLRLLVLKQVENRWRRCSLEGQFVRQGFLRKLISIKLSENQRPLVLISTISPPDYGDSSSTLSAIAWRNNAVTIVPFKRESGVTLDCIVYFTGQDPEFRDADGDGITELYVPRAKRSIQYGNQTVIDYSDIYQFNEAECQFHYAGSYSEERRIDYSGVSTI